uniref:Uncharacterized protein n=1 Tax=Glossina austeni TaxID=7395 RepID=A0A1A9UP88_GLOAU
MPLHCRSIRLMKKQQHQEFKHHRGCISMRKHASSQVNIFSEKLHDDEGMLMLSFRLARDTLINYLCLCVVGSCPFVRFRLVALVHETFIAKTIELPHVTFRTKQTDEYVKYT